MPLFQLFKPTIHSVVAIWQISEDETTLVQPLEQKDALLAESYKRFSSSTRRVEWLAVRRLLYELSNNKLNISYLPSGKPQLNDKTYRISISHTRGYAAIFLHHGEEEIGLDIEQISNKVERVRHRFLSEKELMFAEENLKERQTKLLLMWSAKETLYKIMDIEGVDFSEHLHIHAFRLSEQGRFQAESSYVGKEMNYSVYYLLHPDFVMTYAISGREVIQQEIDLPTL